MKISLQWLSDYLPGPLAAQTAADVLTGAGFPVESIETVGDDTVIDVEVTSNRGDCLSHVGVARELGALQSREVKELSPNVAESSELTANVTSVNLEATALCPHYIARVIRKVTIKPSPAWLARRLEAVGVRPINNVVDVTNYVLMEMGQPLHAFDMDKLAGARIVVRPAKKGETIVSIDGKKRELTEDMLVIADAVRPVAVAGVMGGLESEVSSSTKTILLESARFDPLSVRKTSRTLALRSDSSYRFERGLDPTLQERASLRAAQLILETAGGELLAGPVVAGVGSREPKRLTLRLSKLKSVLGVEFPVSDAVDALTRLRLSPVARSGEIDVTIPTDRLDLNLEIDLVEEVARVIGYDKVPTREDIAIRVVPPTSIATATEMIRSTLVAGGYFEAVTFGFISDLLAADFVPIGAHPTSPLPRVDGQVRKADASLRPSIVPSLLEAVRRNEASGTSGAKLFEMGSTFFNDASGKVIETRKLALVGSSDVREVRGVIERLLGRLDANRLVKIIPDTRPGYGQGAAGRIEWGGTVIGHLGKVDRAIAEKLSLREIPAAAEIDVEPLIQGVQLVPQLKSLPKFPSVERDLSFVVSESVRFEALESVVQKVNPQWLDSLKYVTTYRGKPLEKGTKSVTIALVFRSPDQTLTSEQVEASVQRVTEVAKAELGATLRI